MLSYHSGAMIWPGMGDPSKRNKTIKHLIITAVIAISISLTLVFVDQWQNSEDPLRVCINNIDANYKITATLELYVDKQKIEIPANIGNNEGCRHSMYTLTNDGTIHAEWKSEYPFEVGHFLWTWTTYHEKGFPIRDMQQGKSKIFVDGIESPDFLQTHIVQGGHYRAEFTSNAYDEYKEHDFAPPQ